jgi:hypothetical protein
MYLPLRLNNKDQYIEDLNAIRKAVKENGNRDYCHSIVLSHSAESTITFHVNFALEQDLKKIPKKKSLIILGFTTKNHYEFRFSDHKIPCLHPAKEVYQLDIDGSYRSLGYTTALPSITDLDLQKSIKILNNISAHRLLHLAELDAIARLTIASSEAIKFTAIANNIGDLFGNDKVFLPNPFQIIGWGGRSIAS